MKGNLMRKIFQTLILITFFTSLTLSTQAIDLVKNGKSNYSIVVANDALKTPKFAAKELQNYIEKVTGAKLPITNTPNTDGQNIYIGPSSYINQLGVSLNNIAPEGFIIQTKGNSLIIAGKDTKGDPLNLHWRFGPQTGTLFGVYDFIEKFLGVRWFMPTETGEFIPKKSSLILPSINIKDEPAFITRNLYVPDKNSNDAKLWLRRNKVGRSLIVQHSHNWFYLIPCYPSPKGWAKWLKKRYPYKDHPEYYALANGRRIMTHNVAVGAKHNGQICTSNKDVQRICAEAAFEHFKDKPDVPMMSLSANDGGGYCECKNCTSLDVYASPNDNSFMSDRLMSFYNGVGKLVYDKAPDKLLGAYCYGSYTAPPKKIRPFKNLCLWDVHNGSLFLFTHKTRAERQVRIRKWGKLHDKMFYYTAYNDSGFWGLPTSTRRHLADLLKFTKSCGYKGQHLYGFGCWGGSNLEYYITAKTMWDTTLDIEQLLDDYYTKCYGKKAGKKIRMFHNLLEEETRKFAERNIDKLSTTDDLGVIKISPKDKIKPYYSNIRKQARDLLNQAVKLAPKSKQKQRAQIVSDNFKLVELTLDALSAYEKVKNNLSLKSAMNFKKAVDKREEFVNDNQNSLTINYEEVRGDDKEFNLPVTTAMADYFLATKGKKRSVDCKATNSTITIDGNLDEAVWKNTATITDFVKKDDAAPAEFQTTTRILRDNDNLYIGLECTDPATDKLLENITSRDGKVWQDNEIELFFDPKRNGKTIYQFIFNSAGTQFDLKRENGKSNKNWNSNWEVKTSKADGKWFAEVKIALKDIATPLPGDIWGFNLCRVRKTTDGGKVEYSQITPTFGLFMKPEKFADLIMQ